MIRCIRFFPPNPLQSLPNNKNKQSSKLSMQYKCTVNFCQLIIIWRPLAARDDQQNDTGLKSCFEIYKTSRNSKACAVPLRMLVAVLANLFPVFPSDYTVQNCQFPHQEYS